MGADLVPFLRAHVARLERLRAAVRGACFHPWPGGGVNPWPGNYGMPGSVAWLPVVVRAHVATEWLPRAVSVVVVRPSDRPGWLEAWAAYRVDGEVVWYMAGVRDVG